MAKIIYPTLEQVLAIHYDQVLRYGGSQGIRDLTLLQSALERPKSSFMGEDLYPSLFHKVAALIHSILLNHPFLDGNKRTSMASGGYFLSLNGFHLKVTQQALVEVALNIESKKRDLEYISQWLKVNSVRTKA